MPGPVSDSYDPEWGTGENRRAIEEALQGMHSWLGREIKKPPRYILDVVQSEDEGAVHEGMTFTERDLRILRFACERAKGSL